MMNLPDTTPEEETDNEMFGDALEDVEKAISELDYKMAIDVLITAAVDLIEYKFNDIKERQDEWARFNNLLSDVIALSRENETALKKMEIELGFKK